MENDLKKDLSDEFVQLSNLSITNLLQCIKSSGVKEQFISDIGTEKYNAIIKDMRSESTIIGMRDFHNWIKLVLISNITKLVSSKDISLLDIAVGRGGDLAKWNKSNVKYVFGFDKSEKSITNEDPEDQGALERLANFKGSKFKDIYFLVGNALKPSKPLLTSIDYFLKKNNLHGFDIVSCQFALHYFFKSEIDLQIVLTMISRYLKTGGYFIGTTTNGDYIKNLFKDIKEKVYSTNLFRIQRNFNKTLKSPYGNEYNFTIFDTKDRANYFNTMGLSTEYLVNFKTLEEVAATVGLVPLKLNIFEEYNSYESKSYKVGKQKGYTEIKKNTISFDDILKLEKWKPKPGSRDLTDEEKELNKLYTTFIFMKI
jgi:mRNA (guanine-N7-)-methyltransferase